MVDGGHIGQALGTAGLQARLQALHGRLAWALGAQLQRGLLCPRSHAAGRHACSAGPMRALLRSRAARDRAFHRAVAVHLRRRHGLRRRESARWRIVQAVPALHMALQSRDAALAESFSMSGHCNPSSSTFMWAASE